MADLEGYAQTFAGLLRKRAELAGIIESASKEMRRAMAEMEHIDATIRVFDPTYRVEEIRPKTFRPPEDWAKRGQMQRLVMAALREATEPLTVRDLTLVIMGERGMDRDDDRLVQNVMRRVGSPLRRLRDQGAVRFIELGGQYGAWVLAN